MKYIIAENKIDALVLKYLDSKYDVSELNWTNPIDWSDEDGNEDPNRVYFYYGDYEGEDWTEYVFQWYDKGYYENDDEVYSDMLAVRAPLLAISTDSYIDLNSFFGEKWHEPFKKWFFDNFDLEVKTIVPLFD